MAIQQKADKLRGRQALVEFDGRTCRVDIVTHIRGSIWLVDGLDLPKRFERYRGCRRTTVSRDALTLIADPPVVRKARNALDLMIDKACGLA